jgi:DNA-binding NtrC family response regulator
MGAAGDGSDETSRAGVLLVVEPDFQIREILVSAFEGEAIEVVAVRGDREARAVLNARDVDFALIEIVLRDGNGETLAEVAEGQGCRVALISGHPDGILQGEASPRDFLAKPFAIRDLKQMVLTGIASGAEG